MVSKRKKEPTLKGKPGRPRKIPRKARPAPERKLFGVLKVRSLRLDDDTYNILKRHGSGSASLGARILARQFAIVTRPVQGGKLT